MAGSLWFMMILVEKQEAVQAAVFIWGVGKLYKRMNAMEKNQRDEEKIAE